jgi:hypothetical protein
MSAKVETLLGLIDLEGDFPHAGQRWLKGDQPTIAARLECSPRTLRNIIKDPVFATHRTRVGGTNVTLIRRADAKSANAKSANRQIGKSEAANQQSPKAKSATKPAAKPAKPANPAKIDATFEQLEARVELRRIWLAHQFKFTTDRVTPKEYGLLLELAKLGTTSDEFRYVLNNWREFLVCVNATCPDEAGDSKLKAYKPEPWLGTMVEFHEAVKEVYLTHQQAKKSVIDKYAHEL